MTIERFTTTSGAPLTGHTHDGRDLTVNCPACIAIVQRDQENAWWVDAPYRTCTWAFIDMTAGGWVKRTFTMDVRAPTSAEPWQVDERYMHLTGDEILATLHAAHPTITGDVIAEAAMWACDGCECITVGRIVPEPVAVADDTQLSLLDGEV